MVTWIFHKCLHFIHLRGKTPAIYSLPSYTKLSLLISSPLEKNDKSIFFFKYLTPFTKFIEFGAFVIILGFAY